MKILCNKTTKKIEGFTKWDNIEHDLATHIVLDVDYVPDMETERLNDNEDGVRSATQAELDADADAELDEKVNFANVDPFLKAYVLAVNDGSFVPGSNYTGEKIKAIIRVKL